MSLRLKTLLASGLILLCLRGIGYLVLQIVLSDSFARLDQGTRENHVP